MILNDPSQLQDIVKPISQNPSLPEGANFISGNNYLGYTPWGTLDNIPSLKHVTIDAFNRFNDPLLQQYLGSDLFKNSSKSYGITNNIVQGIEDPLTTQAYSKYLAGTPLTQLEQLAITDPGEYSQYIFQRDNPDTNDDSGFLGGFGGLLGTVLSFIPALAPIGYMISAASAASSGNALGVLGSLAGMGGLSGTIGDATQLGSQGLNSSQISDVLNYSGNTGPLNTLASNYGSTVGSLGNSLSDLTGLSGNLSNNMLNSAIAGGAMGATNGNVIGGALAGLAAPAIGAGVSGLGNNINSSMSDQQFNDALGGNYNSIMNMSAEPSGVETFNYNPPEVSQGITIDPEQALVDSFNTPINNSTSGNPYPTGMGPDNYIPELQDLNSNGTGLSGSNPSLNSINPNINSIGNVGSPIGTSLSSAPSATDYGFTGSSLNDSSLSPSLGYNAASSGGNGMGFLDDLFGSTGTDSYINSLGVDTSSDPTAISALSDLLNPSATNYGLSGSIGSNSNLLTDPSLLNASSAPYDWGPQDLTNTLNPDYSPISGSDGQAYLDYLNSGIGNAGLGATATTGSGGTKSLSDIVKALTNGGFSGDTSSLIAQVLATLLETSKANTTNNFGQGAISTVMNKNAGLVPISKGAVFGQPSKFSNITPATNGVYAPLNLGMTRK